MGPYVSTVRLTPFVCVILGPSLQLMIRLRRARADHVFCETPFIGHAWAVGRVMELLGPAPLPAQGAPSSSKDGEMRVKLAVYLRYARVSNDGKGRTRADPASRFPPAL